MRDFFKDYFDSIYGMKPFGDNNELFTAEYCSLAQGNDQLTKAQVGYLLRNINPIDSEGKWSRDNHMGYISLSKQFGFDYHKKLYLSNIKYMLQPWDLILFVFASEGLLSFLVLPLLPITSLAMILTVLVTSYKTINGQQVLATDGQMLTRLMASTFNLPITRRITNYIVKKKYSGYAYLSNIYFGPDHPVSVLLKEQGL